MGNNAAEILLYDQIADFDSDKWGLISAKGLINKIKDLGQIENITLRINSVGGDVFEAQAIYSYLKSHPANITVKEALKLKFCDEVGESVKISAITTKTGGFVCINKSGLSRLDDFMRAKLPANFKVLQEWDLPMPENTQNQVIQSAQNGANSANYGT